MKCIVIDDEPLALGLIADYIRKTPFLEFIEGFTNPFQAIEFLLKTKVDLVFIDINMPELTGIELLKSLPVLPRVIFTTAYSEFGAESYEYNAVDYLLKPVKYDRFLKAVNRALDAGAGKEVAIDHPDEGPETDYLIIKSGPKKFKILKHDILYIEGAGNYLTFFTLKGRIMALISMSDVLIMLGSESFVRIHKSYIVSLKHIEIIEKHRVIINKASLPIGITYREHFSRMMK
jgi:DNA-binding LytR/AlgR family response regulator